MNKLSILFAFVALVALQACNSKPKEAEKPAKPNVIVVITDDQGYGDLACNGNPIIQTPHIDKFNGESARFTNFHVGTTCAPTRAGLMTGRNANRVNTWHTIGGCSLLNEEEVTIADVFQQNGYETAMVGKWHLGDNYPFRPQDRGFTQAFYHGGGGVGQTPDYWLNDYIDDTYFRNGVPEQTKGHCTDVWFNEAQRFVEAHQKDPFFLYLSLNAPHGPYNVPEKYFNMYKDRTDLAPHQKRFYGMITQVDEQFGKLDAKLQELGIADNTILIFMTDNGSSAALAGGKKGKKNKVAAKTTGYNAGLRGMKGSQYDGGHRVPFIMRWPKGGINKGTDINELTAHVDVLPTLSELCGLELPATKPLDGMSVVPLITGKKSNTDFNKRMLVTDTQRIQWPVKGRNSCVMTSQWRLVNGDELYDINADRGQTNNIAADHPQIVKEMTAFYDQWWASAVKDMRYAKIKLGSDAENPMQITCHDMHTDAAIPWNQSYIRKGIELTDGYLLCDVTKAGKYKFTVARYPKESGLAIDATVEDIKGSKWFDYIPAGKSLSLSKPSITINNKEYPCKFNADRTEAIVELDLPAGEIKYYGEFTNAEKQRVRGYYYTVERL
ncbi:arylsulfatase [Saccharicrinis aurantiacus]|uniref:arylsulfatase n=1 Tax=Saccharicrinis aurantiacus TaxID=1849719 RepID=UPI00249335F7|nr:arylsulfatase [Saccharicrinis aurantiacus]